MYITAKRHNPHVRPLSSPLYTCITFPPQSAAFLRQRPPTRSRNHYSGLQLICSQIGDHAASEKKVCKAFLRRKLIYSISTLVCSICGGVFNVNPQSGIEFPRRGGRGWVAGRGAGGRALLIVQLKGRAISGHVGPRFACTMKRNAAYIHGEHSVSCQATGRIRNAPN